MHLQGLYASPALIEAARERDDLRVVEEPEPIQFEAGGFTAPTPAEVDDAAGSANDLGGCQGP